MIIIRMIVSLIVGCYKSFGFLFAVYWYALDELFKALEWGMIKKSLIRLIYIVVYPLLWIVLIIVQLVRWMTIPGQKEEDVRSTLEDVDMKEVFFGSVDKAAKEAVKKAIDEW